MWGVFGNNDQERDSLDAAIAATRIPLRGAAASTRSGTNAGSSSSTIRASWTARCSRDHHVALHGHTHHHRLDREHSQLIFNPGECAGHLEGYNAVGVVDLDSLDAQLLRF